MIRFSVGELVGRLVEGKLVGFVVGVLVGFVVGVFVGSLVGSFVGATVSKSHPRNTATSLYISPSNSF